MKKSNLNHIITLLLYLTSTLLLECGIAPEPINYGKDECDNCKMLITDDRYGAEILTDKGKIYKFDSIECLVSFSLNKNILGNADQSFLVNDFSQPKKLINTTNAFYILNDNFRSPMGLNVLAFENNADAEKFRSENGGSNLTWLDVIERVKQI